MSEDSVIAERLRAMEKEMSGSKEWLRSIDIKLEHLKEKVFSTPQCPKPGTCVTLERAIIDHEERLRKMEDIMSQIRGAGVAAKLFWMIAGGTITGLIIYLIKL